MKKSSSRPSPEKLKKRQSAADSNVPNILAMNPEKPFTPNHQSSELKINQSLGNGDNSMNNSLLPRRSGTILKQIESKTSEAKLPIGSSIINQKQLNPQKKVLFSPTSPDMKHGETSRRKSPKQNEIVSMIPNVQLEDKKEDDELQNTSTNQPADKTITVSKPTQANLALLSQIAAATSNSSSRSSNIRVYARVRPINEVEKDLLEGGVGSICVEYHSSNSKATNSIVIRNPNGNSSNPYVFDMVFPSESAQQSVYNVVGKEIVKDVLSGYNGTIFAYGQSGSGKTFTMYGCDIYDDDNKGIIPRLISDIFDHVDIAGENITFQFKMSILQIYKEVIYDLLTGDKDLKIKENPIRGIYVDKLTEVYVNSIESFMESIDLAQDNRIVSETKLNNTSSRSHSILIFEVTQSNLNENFSKKGTLNLVDLAGSEKISKTGAVGETLEEAKKINLSLSALGHVIHSLTSGADHIPYRDSKLTRILQESLGGNFKTSLIVTCSPHSYHLEETISSLQFAQRAKTIKNRAKMNIKLTYEELQKIITQLRKSLEKANAEILRLKNLLPPGTEVNFLPLNDETGDIPNAIEDKSIFNQTGKLEKNIDISDLQGEENNNPIIPHNAKETIHEDIPNGTNFFSSDDLSDIEKEKSKKKYFSNNNNDNNNDNNNEDDSVIPIVKVIKKKDKNNKEKANKTNKDKESINDYDKDKGKETKTSTIEQFQTIQPEQQSQSQTETLNQTQYEPHAQSLIKTQTQLESHIQDQINSIQIKEIKTIEQSSTNCLNCQKYIEKMNKLKAKIDLLTNEAKEKDEIISTLEETNCKKEKKIELLKTQTRSSSLFKTDKNDSNSQLKSLNELYDEIKCKLSNIESKQIESTKLELKMSTFTDMNNSITNNLKVLFEKNMNNTFEHSSNGHLLLLDTVTNMLLKTLGIYKDETTSDIDYSSVSNAFKEQTGSIFDNIFQLMQKEIKNSKKASSSASTGNIDIPKAIVHFTTLFIFSYIEEYANIQISNQLNYKINNQNNIMKNINLILVNIVEDLIKSNLEISQKYNNIGLEKLKASIAETGGYNMTFAGETEFMENLNKKSFLNNDVATSQPVSLQRKRGKIMTIVSRKGLDAIKAAKERSEHQNFNSINVNAFGATSFINVINCSSELQDNNPNLNTFPNNNKVSIVENSNVNTEGGASNFDNDKEKQPKRRMTGVPQFLIPCNNMNTFIKKQQNKKSKLTMLKEFIIKSIKQTDDFKKDINNLKEHFYQIIKHSQKSLLSKLYDYGIIQERDLEFEISTEHMISQLKPTTTFDFNEDYENENDNDNENKSSLKEKSTMRNKRTSKPDYQLTEESHGIFSDQKLNTITSDFNLRKKEFHSEQIKLHKNVSYDFINREKRRFSKVHQKDIETLITEYLETGTATRKFDGIAVKYINHKARCSYNGGLNALNTIDTIPIQTKLQSNAGDASFISYESNDEDVKK